MDVQENALKAGQVPKGSADWGKEPEEMWGKIKTEHKGLQFSGIVESEAGNYTDYFINVRDAIWGTAELIVKAEQARDTIQIIELAMQSSREKRAVQL
jgi:predicted dehydrogenase